MKVEWAAGAEAAYLEFLTYLNEVQPLSAIKAQRDVERIATRLAKRPAIGHVSRWKGLMEWSLVRWKKILVYRVDGQRLQVIAFYDARQDLTKVKPRA